MTERNMERVDALIEETASLKQKNVAVALDFDGVCKRFTKHKHQIMSTLLFLHLEEFQRAPFDAYMKAYGYVNFLSPEYAGKARFLCVNALAKHLNGRGFDCALPGIDEAVCAVEAAGGTVNADSLQVHAGRDQVKRILAWSDEVDRRVAQLTEISLTPGIRQHVLDPMRNVADFYVVSTATERSIRPAMEREGIDYVLRYFGQESAGKFEALSCLCRCGYRAVFMFGDSVEDSRASDDAGEVAPEDVELIFCPVVPDEEEASFASGEAVMRNVMEGASDAARALAAEQRERFEGKEAGSDWSQ